MRSSASILALAAVAVAVAIVVVALGGNPAPTESMRAHMPDHIRNAPQRVVAAYEYAATHMEEVAKYPCYCGCGVMGHTSNLSCYVQPTSNDGEIVWDNHALGCQICVDITLDVQRLKAANWSSPDTRDYIDAKYGTDYGPGTNTPYPAN